MGLYREATCGALSSKGSHRYGFIKDKFPGGGTCSSITWLDTSGKSEKAPCPGFKFPKMTQSKIFKNNTVALNCLTLCAALQICQKSVRICGNAAIDIYLNHICIVRIAHSCGTE